MRRFLHLILVIAMVVPCANAQTTEAEASSKSNERKSDSDDFIKKLSYPELDVSPRASERLLMEAQREQKTQWRTHLPLQISALSILMVGVMISGKPSTALMDGNDVADISVEQNGYASKFAILVGTSWLVTTTLMSISYTPYQSGLEKSRKEGGKSIREQLTKERLAEEALEAPALLSPILVNLSVVTNLLAAVYAGLNADQQGTLLSGISGLLAFTPLVFDYRWEYVYEQHQLYKKRIYGPVSYFKTDSFDSTGTQLVPYLALAADF
jgi:hypothetical protein